MKCVAKQSIDSEILRSLGLCEVVEQKRVEDGKEKKFTVEKYKKADGKLVDAINAGDEVEILEADLWRRGIYDEESFNEKLGALFSEPKGLTKSKPEVKKVEEKEMKIAKGVAKIEEKATEEIEELAEKEAKK